MATVVRFAEEDVVHFEVHSEGSAALHGLEKGDKVTWSDADDDVPRGSVGEVTGFGSGGIVQVRFSNGTWDFRAQELHHQEPWATSVQRVAVQKAECLMRELKVLEAEAVLAEALFRLSEVVALEKFAEEMDEELCSASQGSSHSSSHSTETPDDKHELIGIAGES